MAEEKTQSAGTATIDPPGENTVELVFLPEGKTVQFEHGQLPYKDHGKEQSILDVALNNGIRLDHACGGNCACSTCHVYVSEGFNSLSEQREEEEDILDKAFDVRATSRLGCQSRVDDEDVTVEITRESRQAWLDEHPEERAKLKEAQR